MKRTLIIGDIHGCYDELLALCDRAAVTDDDIVISVGDLVDRGPRPSEVVRWFRNRPNAIVLMGNHERKHVRNVLSYSQEVTRLQMGEAYASDVEWMKGLPYFHETPDIRVVHAAMVSGVPLAEQDEAILAGTTSGEARLNVIYPEGWWHEHYTDPVPVAFGHHVTGPEPLIRAGAIYGIDTGACHGHRLTALSVPDFAIHSVPSTGDHWPVVAREYQLPILRTRRWGEMSWKKLAEAIAERADDRVDTSSVDVATYLAAVTAWADAIRRLIPAILERIPVIAAELRAAHGSAGFQAAASAHPAKPLLFLLERNKLTLDAIEVRCPSPAATVAFAQKLGVTTDLTVP